MQNLEKFPLNTDQLDNEYYNIVAKAIESTDLSPRSMESTRFYVQKKMPFYVGTKRYYEITLQLANKYATKFNRITVYSKQNISTGYSINIGYTDTTIDLWGIASNIKIITNWRVSIAPTCLNKLGRILNIPLSLNANYGEYAELMSFLTKTGMTLLDLIDLQEMDFHSITDQIYGNTNTKHFREVIEILRRDYSSDSVIFGKNVVRYLLINLREKSLIDVMPNRFTKMLAGSPLYLASGCRPFERNPLLANLGYSIVNDSGLVTISAYETITLKILQRLLDFTQAGIKGQKELNARFIKDHSALFDKVDVSKQKAIKYAFVNSRILLIYGAAGTGKTTLINYISSLMPKSKKLFLTKTHAAIQHLQRRIDNPGSDSDFICIDSFTRRVNLPDYDIIFVDECSTIDNRTMLNFISKISSDSLIVLAGDINQIESIDFGNWFYYAKDIITTHGANVELLDTWRTREENLLSLWEEVRNNDVRITEKLVIDGPFSKEIGSDIFTSDVKDEVVLCLNYDGKFGLNNINSYFQNANPNGEAIIWQSWRFKKGDKILFNDNSRFTYLYNNLKGIIVEIEKADDQIAFTIDVETIITEQQCKSDQIEYIDTIDEKTRIKLIVYAFDEDEVDDEENAKKTIIPFQLAYAVSIHKAQGLEYDSVKVVIPSVNTEKITKGVFYTAITRTKKKLTIYWSSETMEAIISGFSSEHNGFKSLEIIKNKLVQTTSSS